MAYFREGEKLITLSQDLHEKSFIEKGINRYLIAVNTLEELVSAVEEESSRNPKVHIIASATMAKEIRQYIDEVVKGLNALTANNRVQVIEIGSSGVFEKSLTFMDIQGFISFCQEQERADYIDYLANQSSNEKQEESRILQELTIERNAAQQRVGELESTLKNSEDARNQLQIAYREIETKINHLYTIELVSVKEALLRKSEEYAEIERLYKLEKAKVADYAAESSKYRSENKALQMDNDSLKALLDEKRTQMHGLQAQITSLELEIAKAEREKVDIIKTRVDSEVHVQLSYQLEEARNALRQTQAKLQEIEANSRKKDFEIAENLKEIEELRKGEVSTQQSNGRTTMLDKVRFKATNVYYVKIITPLPYLRSALQGLYEAIKNRDGGRMHVCVIKHDDGLNDLLFKGYELYGTLGDVQAKHEKFMLYPTRRMFTGFERFDAAVNSVLVLDFIQSSDYYIETDGFSRVMTVCNHSAMLHTLHLQGMPISLDAGSVMDLQYDERIVNAKTKDIQQRYIQLKVNAWLKQLEMFN